MLELSKQIVNIVKPIVHNEIQVVQQQANTKDSSTMFSPQENLANGNESTNQLGDSPFSHLVCNMDK